MDINDKSKILRIKLINQKLKKINDLTRVLRIDDRKCEIR